MRNWPFKKCALSTFLPSLIQATLEQEMELRAKADMKRIEAEALAKSK